MSNAVIIVEQPSGELILSGDGSAVYTVDAESNMVLADSANGDVLLLVDRGEKGDPGGVASVFGRIGIVTAQSTDYAAFYQPLDSDLTTFSGLTPTTGQLLAYGASAWESRELLAADIPGLPATKIVSGVFADIQIPGSIARDSEVAAAIAAITAASIGALTQSVADTLYEPILSPTGTASAPGFLSYNGTAKSWRTVIDSFKIRALSNYPQYPGYYQEFTYSGSKVSVVTYWNKQTDAISPSDRFKLLTQTFTYSGSKVASIAFLNDRTAETITKTFTYSDSKVSSVGVA